MALSQALAAEKPDPFVIVPGRQIGLVKLPASEADVLKAYGAEAQPAEIDQLGGGLVRATVLYPCDETRMATILYDAKTHMVSAVDVPVYGFSAACLFRRRLDPYKDHADPLLKDQAPGDFLDTSKYDWKYRSQWIEAAPNPFAVAGGSAAPMISQWHLQDGVHPGMTVAELQTLNGKPFEITGPDGDAPGGVTNWLGGALTNCIWAVTLAGLPDDGGEGARYRSDNPKLAKPGIVADALFVHAAEAHDWQACSVEQAKQ